MKQRYNINIDKEIHDKAVKACKLISKEDDEYRSLSAQIEADLRVFVESIEEHYSVKL